MEINTNAPLVAEHRIVIAAPRPAVWALLTDIADWPRWHSAITRAELDGPLAPASSFRWTSGGMAIVSTLQLVEHERRLGWTGKALGTTTEHIWTLEEHPEGTLVTTAESMSGWLIYPVKLITPGFLSDALQTWLAALRRAAEPQPSPALALP
jgi:uncharacterized protein YndB with AHSA1/START domain